MGIYFNPGNMSFVQARNSMIYVDKTRLLEFLNKRLYTEDKCIALSHARRFGKSHAAGMIDAYYSRGCDSTKLFEDTKLAADADYKKHMNKYNVIHLDFGILTRTILLKRLSSMYIKILGLYLGMNSIMRIASVII